MWIILGIVGGLALTRFIVNLRRSHKDFPNTWEFEFDAWHKWDQAANLATALGAFAGIALFFPIFEYYQSIPGEADNLAMPILICVALIIPGAIFGSIASTKKKQAGIGR